MFSKSGTNTPVPGGATASNLHKIQYHEPLDETITWIKDWYCPNLSNDLSDDAINDSVRLKGWYKTNINHKNGNVLYNPDDVLNLNDWKYYRDTPMSKETSGQTSSEDSNMDIDEVKKLGAAIKYEDDGLGRL
ncbi:hypothetical protein JA1_003084 [Spathaspora sp. JA1]|nr:hypothetical protein JA1_003084 [Spathaspora sp. JA1]